MRPGQVSIVAAYATRQGVFKDATGWSLGVDALRGALSESGIARDSIDGLLTQLMQDGSGQMAPSRFGQMIGLNPMVSGALQYGTAAFTLAYAAGLIMSGQCSVVACVYGTNQRSSDYRFGRSYDPFGTPYGFLNPAGFAALSLQKYLHKFDRLAERDKLAAIAINQRRNAGLNPIALRKEPLALEDYLQSRWIVWPLRRDDICLINDGAACIILADSARARDLTDRPILIAGIGRQDALYVPDADDQLLMPHMKSVASQLHERTGFRPEDVDALYVQDAHASAILFALENYGFCQPGEALDFIQDGRIAIEGELPINSNGGQLSEGYLVGWLHLVEIFRQLRGQAGPRQIADCNVAQFCATGGYREFAASILFTGPGLAG
jgi:acetyl-CoA acetyltransferase